MKLLMLIFMVGAIFIAPTYGQQCDVRVVDEAGEFGDRIGEVDAAAQQLQDLGADVRVRTIKTYKDFGTLDAYIAQLRSQCPSWQAPDGQHLKTNFYVIAHSRQDRQTGTYFGYQWKEPLGKDYVRIQAEHMKPRFMDNDYTGAFIAGMGETKLLLNNYLHPTQAQTTTNTTFNFGYLGVGMVLVALIVCAVIFAPKVMESRRIARAERNAIRAQQQAAIASKQRAANRLLHAQSADSELYEEATTLFALYGPQGEFAQPEDEGRSLQEYLEIKKAFDEVNAKLDQADRAELSLVG